MVTEIFKNHLYIISVFIMHVNFTPFPCSLPFFLLLITAYLNNYTAELFIQKQAQIYSFLHSLNMFPLSAF